MPEIERNGVVGAEHTPEDVVRAFMQRTLETRAAWHRGDSNTRDPLHIIEQDARETGALFTSPRYGAIFSCSPARVRAVMTYLLPRETAHYGDAGIALFMWIAAQTAEAAAALESGRPETDVRTQLDGIVSDVVDRLHA